MLAIHRYTEISHSVPIIRIEGIHCELKENTACIEVLRMCDDEENTELEILASVNQKVILTDETEKAIITAIEIAETAADEAPNTEGTLTDDNDNPPTSP